MGSRAIVIVCRDEAVARERFGVAEAGIGACYTRTGRPFFKDAALEAELLDIVRGALDGAEFWQEQNTDWVCLDCELMPWSAKAQELIRNQYAAVGAAAGGAFAAALGALGAARPDAARPWTSCSLTTRPAPTLPPGTPTPTATTPGRSIRWTTCASLLFTCWLPKAPSTSTGTTAGTWQRWRQSAAPRTGCFSQPSTTWWTSPIPRARPTRYAGGRN